MGTKVKGLLKGLRYISQIFEEEKEPEMQIGLPTDVKHVAHIGWDGPTTVQESPSWMKEYESPEGGFQSAPLMNGPAVAPVDARRGGAGTKGRDMPDLPKSTRRHAAPDNNNANANDSPRKKDASTKSRQSRRNHSKDSSEGGSFRSSTRHLQEMAASGGDSPSRDLPDMPKKARRKKSKEGTTKPTTTTSSSGFSDRGLPEALVN